MPKRTAKPRNKIVTRKIKVPSRTEIGKKDFWIQDYDIVNGKVYLKVVYQDRGADENCFSYKWIDYSKADNDSKIVKGDKD